MATTDTSAYEDYVTTSQLKTGDVVITHGMHVRLGSRTEFPGVSGQVAWAFDGTVENLDELESNHPARGLIGPNGEWVIQGNDLATWTREASYEVESAHSLDECQECRANYDKCIRILTSPTWKGLMKSYGVAANKHAVHVEKVRHDRAR